MTLRHALRVFVETKYLSTSPRLYVFNASAKKNVFIPEKIVILQKNKFENSS